MVFICLLPKRRSGTVFEDLHMQDDIPFFNFTDEGEDQGLKCDGSSDKEN
jgi:hypothetical protein